MVIPQLLQSIKPLGFRRKKSQDVSGYLAVEGALETRFGLVPCDVFIDRELRSFPTIILQQPLSELLLPFAPHVGPDGFLCYVAEGTLVFDMYRPISQTIAALKRAEVVLDQIMAKERVDDLEEEFFAFWRGDYCYTDIERPESGEVAALSLGKGQGLVFTDDLARAESKFAYRAGRVEALLGVTAKITTKVPPRPLIGAWPPKTVGELLDWQSKLDPPCRRKILARIIKAYRADKQAIVVVIDAPTIQYGFLVTDLQKYKRTSKADQGTPIFEAPIELMQMVRMDDRYIVGRNIPGQKTLAGKKIALVGCGTIGGYLADLLVKAGAGTGGGELQLIDNQKLAPGNIGRHRLGANRLELNKAQGLVTELKIGMPSANVRALPEDAFSVNLAGFDLIIDATGEQGLGNWLAGQQANGSLPNGGWQTPLLHVWIEGSGEAVRALLKQHRSEGCYRCLCDYEAEQRFLSVAGGVRPILAGGGCEGQYVAYPASVSVQAAALGLDAALAWVGATLWAPLSTRVISRAHDPATGDVTILPRPRCPACGS
jgi:molybdopterin/thiamine biosynthesis adenylyltransferase